MKIFINDIEISLLYKFNLFFNNEFGVNATIYYNKNVYDGNENFKKVIITNFNVIEISKKNINSIYIIMPNITVVRNIFDIDKIVIRKSLFKNSEWSSKPNFFNN